MCRVSSALRGPPPQTSFKFSPSRDVGLTEEKVFEKINARNSAAAATKKSEWNANFYYATQPSFAPYCGPRKNSRKKIIPSSAFLRLSWQTLNTFPANEIKTMCMCAHLFLGFHIFREQIFTCRVHLAHASWPKKGKNESSNICDKKEKISWQNHSATDFCWCSFDANERRKWLNGEGENLIL